MADSSEIRHLREQVENLKAENARLREDAKGVAEANVRAAKRMIEMSEERRRALEERQSELQAALEQAQRADQRKTEFLSLVSHELRTPMNGIHGMLSLIQEAGVSEEIAGYLQTAMTSASQLMRVIEDILDLRSDQGGVRDLTPSEFPLINLVEEVVQAGAQALEGSAVEFALHIAPEVPRNFEADRIRLRQVLENLVLNAVKFTERGSILLEAQCPEPGTLRFSVRDTGCGIRPEYLPHLFDAFSQQDSSFSRSSGGSGLGLAISQSIASAMGSRLEVESEEGVGSTFWFDLEIPESADTALRGAFPEPPSELAIASASDLLYQSFAAHLQHLGTRT